MYVASVCNRMQAQMSHLGLLKYTQDRRALWESMIINVTRYMTPG